MNRLVRRASVCGRSEAGVTLIELLVAVVISGIIVSAIAGSIIVGFKTTDKTTTRLAESHDTQLVANYFPSDVSSARFADISVATTPSSGCTGLAPGGTNVVLLPYAPRPDAADPVTVTYRIEGSGSTKELVRYRCAGSGPASQITVASNLSAATAAASTYVADATEQRTVTVTVIEASGRVFNVSGHPRTPKSVADLPTTIPGTTAPPAPCVGTPTVSPATLALAATNPDTMSLSGDVTLSVDITGDCAAPLSVTFTPGSSVDPSVTRTLTAVGSTFDVTLGATAYNWKTGTKTLALNQAGGASVGGTVPRLKVTAAPCTVQGPVSVTPDPVTLAASPPGNLAQPLVISFTTAGTCQPLDLRLSPGASVVARVLTAGPGNTWSTTIQPADYAWTAGPPNETVVIHQGGAQDPVVNNSFTFTILPAPCVLDTVALAGGPFTVEKNGKLNQNVTVNVTTIGTCSSQLTVKYATTPSGSDVSPAPALGSSGPGMWTVNLSKNQNWGAGTIPISVIGPTNTLTSNLVVS